MFHWKPNPFRRMLWSYKESFLGGWLALALNIAMLNIIPWFISGAVASLEGQQSFVNLERVMLLAPASILLLALSHYGSRFLVLGAARSFARDLRVAVFHRDLVPSTCATKESSVSRSMTKLSNDAGLCEALFGPGLLYFFQGLTWLMIAALSIATLNPQLIFAIVLPWLVLGLSLSSSLKKTRFAAEREQECKDQWAFDLAQAKHGRSFLHQWGQDEQVVGHFQEWNEKGLKYSQRRVLHRSRVVFLVNSIYGLSLVVLLALGHYQLRVGAVSLGELAAVITTVAMMYHPMFQLAWVSTLASQAAPSIERLSETLEIPTHSLQFSKNSPLRLDLRLTAVPGQWTSLTCESSEELKPILRDLELKSGDSKTSDHLEREPDLFELSIQENLCLGQKVVSQGQLERAIYHSCLDEVLNETSAGLSRKLGPGGLGLSGGQRQRLALARALLREPKQLIINDALSMLDSATLQRLLTRLRQIEGMTVFLISEDPQILNFVDRHLVVHPAGIQSYLVIKKDNEPILCPLAAQDSTSAKAA